MTAFRIGLLFSFIAAASSVVVCRPAWLAHNEFLIGFINHEIVAVLVVILTITFASVANIHLALNRIEARARPDRKVRIKGIRTEVNAAAWNIFWAFVVCVIALVIKGAFSADIHVVAAVHAVGLTVLLLNALILHAIYRAIFALVTVEKLLGGNREEDGASNQQDYTNEGPPAGSA